MASVTTEDRLQQYFDGELSAEEADTLRREIADDADLRAKIAGLEHLRTLVQANAEADADGVDSEALWAGIAARMGEAADEDPMFPSSQEPARPALGVVEGGKKAAPKKTRTRSVVWASIGATLAAAAAVFLIVTRPFDNAPVQPAPPPGSEIVEVDFGYSTGAIFSVEQEGAHYAVIWISDEKPEVEERIQ